MKRWEAIKALEDGHKVRKVHWDKDYYLFMDGEKRIVNKFNTNCGGEFTREEDWAIWEEPGHDWEWAKQQLRNGKKVKRKSNIDTFYLDRFGCIIMVGEPGEKDEPKYHFIDDDTATDWVLA